MENDPSASGQVPPEPALSATEQAMELIHAGGPVVIILLFLSVIALTVILLKFWQFSSYKLSDRGPLNKALKAALAGQFGEAMEPIATHRNPISEVMLMALRGKRQEVPEGQLREMLQCAAADRLESLRSQFRILEVIASLAPLLGLLGTVLGMIEAFRALEAAGSQVDPAILSGGMWEALLTTAVGLSVAIPVVAMLNYFERRVDRIAHEMGRAVTIVFTQGAMNEVAPRGESGAGYTAAVALGR